MASLKKAWNPMLAIPILGALSAFYFGLTQTFWAVTGEFTRWGASLMNLVGIDTSHYSYLKLIHYQGTVLDRVDGIMIIGMFLGAFVAALISNNVKLRWPTSKIRIGQAIGGGILAGFGARLAMGCNLAAFFTGIPQFSLHAWIFTIFTVIGTYFGTKIIKMPFFRPRVKLQRKNSHTLADLHQGDHTSRNRVLLILAGVAIVGLFFVEANKAALLPWVLVFGLAFGFLLEKGQVCFTSAFRDLWTAGRTNMTKAIIVGMLVSTIITYFFIHSGIPAKIMWAGPNVVIGGFVFGIGIVIAGGCETGWMYRAMEGQVHYMLVGVGNIIGAMLLVISWDALAPKIVMPFPKVNLLTSLGNYGGLAFTYGALLLSLLLVMWYERHFFKKNSQPTKEALAHENGL
ncbi:MAG: selenium metabolism membrane protein YedE/FdhT [Lactobacillus sp.]|jgi:uncharacterized membrane protein YedE/YeeE|nr:selenium metabolism membrane protein YedE/FdhT [Lactobacillus sp.]